MQFYNRHWRRLSIPRTRSFRNKGTGSRRLQAAADFLNLNDVDIVCLQFEYGIFGGKAGSYILSLLRNLKMPVITTLHTVLKKSKYRTTPCYGWTTCDIWLCSCHVQETVEILHDVFKIPPGKVRLIPHGIHDVPFIDPNFYKDKYGVEGKTVILTFGLLSPQKGIEVVLRALPKVIKNHPMSFTWSPGLHTLIFSDMKARNTGFHCSALRTNLISKGMSYFIINLFHRRAQGTYYACWYLHYSISWRKRKLHRELSPILLAQAMP